jgi:hypothetical protein
MASGRLGAIDISSAATDTIIYTVPVGATTVATVSFVNRGNSACTVRLAVSVGSTAATNEYIEYETELLPKGVLERTGIVLDAGKNIIARTSALPVNVVVYGMES